LSKVVDGYARNPFDRRLDRLEIEVQKRTYPGYGPIFKLTDNPLDSENPNKQFLRDNPTGMIIRHVIVSPPRGKPNWEGVSREERERWLADYDRYDGLKNAFQEPDRRHSSAGDALSMSAFGVKRT
jgi:hypothetical protein